MTDIRIGYETYYFSMMEWNIGFDHDEFWNDKVAVAVKSYQKHAKYLYDYELYLIDIKNYKDALAPVIEEEIVFEYIENFNPEIIYQSKSKLERNREMQRGQ